MARLLESLNINPQELPSSANEASWDRIYQAAGTQGHPPMVATDVAAGAAMVSQVCSSTQQWRRRQNNLF